MSDRRNNIPERPGTTSGTTSERYDTNSTVRDTYVEKPRSNRTMAFIVGAIVVAIGIIAWIMLADNDAGVDTATVPAEGADTTVTTGPESVTVVEPEAEPAAEPESAAEPVVEPADEPVVDPEAGTTEPASN